MNRRHLLMSSAGAAAGAAATWNSLLSPVKALAAEVKPVRIKDVETFQIVIPATPTEEDAGVMSRIGVTRVTTESGVRGHSFGGFGGGGRGGRGGAGAAAVGGAPAGRVGGPGGSPLPNPVSFAQMRDALIGADLFAMEQHLKHGLLYQGGIEEALWDAI